MRLEQVHQGRARWWRATWLGDPGAVLEQRGPWCRTRAGALLAAWRRRRYAGRAARRDVSNWR